MSDQSDLYDTDIARWSECQADLLRRMGKGERVNDQVDWENVAEEIEDMGNNVVRSVASHLVQALLHDLKAEAWPLSRDVPHWQAEARVFRAQARRRFVPSMRQRIDFAGIYADAVRGLPDTIDGQAPLPVPDVCPVTLDELLSSDPAA